MFNNQIRPMEYLCKVNLDTFHSSRCKTSILTSSSLEVLHLLIVTTTLYAKIYFMSHSGCQYPQQLQRYHLIRLHVACLIYCTKIVFCQSSLVNQCQYPFYPCWNLISYTFLVSYYLGSWNLCVYYQTLLLGGHTFVPCWYTYLFVGVVKSAGG